MSDSHILWFLASVAVLIIAVVMNIWFTRRANLFMKTMRALTDAKSREIENTIREKLSPRIHVHDSEISVAKRAARIIEDVAEEKEAEKFVTFYGAASMSASTQETETEPGVEKESPSTIYRDAIDFASRTRVRMNRYINLFSPEELSERGEKVQSQYLTWLKHQLTLLGKDKRYQLIHVVRAPQWGTNMARILTKTSVMEITGNGKAAIVITDPHIAERIRDYAREAVIGQNTKNKPIAYGLAADAEPLEAFEEYIDKIRAVCPKKR